MATRILMLSFLAGSFLIFFNCGKSDADPEVNRTADVTNTNISANQIRADNKASSNGAKSTPIQTNKPGGPRKVNEPE